MNRYVCVDISTAPLSNCEQWLEPASAPSNYKDPAKIAAYVAEKNADRLGGAALDLDLAWITGIALHDGHSEPLILLSRSERDEMANLAATAAFIEGAQLIGYNIKGFDGPILMRRARYLGVKFPTISVDRYRSGTVDLMQVLSYDERDRRRSLRFYCRRHGWLDCDKPLSGAEEANVPHTGLWAELEASLRGDVTAVWKLGIWLGILEPVKALEPEPLI